MADLYCPNCDENLGKETENPKHVGCGRCGKTFINPKGDDAEFANGGNLDDATLQENGFDPSKLTAEQKERILQPGNDEEGFSQDGELKTPEAIANWLHNLDRLKLDGPDKLRAIRMYPHLFKRMPKGKFEKGGSVPSEITAKLPEINKALYDALVKLYNACVLNGGAVDYPDKDMGWISDSMDIIDIKYYGATPDGDFQEELANDGTDKLNDVEAFAEIVIRFVNTRIDFENSKKGSLIDVNKKLLKAFEIATGKKQAKKFDNQEDEYNSLVEYFSQIANAYLTEDKKMGGKILVKMSARKKRAAPKRNLSRDRMFVSKQEWEQKYDRKTPGKRYHASGGAMNTELYPDDPGYEDAKFIVKIHGVGDPKDHYVSNALRFTTHEAANRYGQNLSLRWSGMDDYKVEEREIEKPKDTDVLVVDVMYRDGANYKKFVENISLQNYSGEIKAGDEITMEELGYTPEEFYELAGVEYDEEYDHNLLEVLDVHPAGENDIIYPPKKMATGGKVLDELDAAQKLRYTDKYTGLFRQGEEVTVLFHGKKEKGVVYDHVGALVDFNASPRMFRHEYFLKLKKVPGVYRFFQDQILEAPERAANPIKIDYTANLVEAERYREKGGVAVQDRQWVMSDWTNPSKDGRYNRYRVLDTDNGFGIFDRQTMQQVKVVKGIKGVRKSPPYTTKEQAEDVTNKLNYDYYQLLDFMWNHEKGGSVNAGMLTFKDKSYPVRTLLVVAEGETEPMEIVVGTESLEAALKKAKWKGKAGKVDEGIYFYVPDSLIVESNQTIADNLDEPFSVVEEQDEAFKTGGKMRAARPKKTTRGKVVNHFFEATNFDLRISKAMAEKVLSANAPILKEVDIMCKEMGKDGLWASVSKRDLVAGRLAPVYKTYEVWISDEKLSVPKLKEELQKLI